MPSKRNGGKQQRCRGKGKGKKKGKKTNQGNHPQQQASGSSNQGEASLAAAAAAVAVEEGVPVLLASNNSRKFTHGEASDASSSAKEEAEEKPVVTTSNDSKKCTHGFVDPPPNGHMLYDAYNFIVDEVIKGRLGVVVLIEAMSKFPQLTMDKRCDNRCGVLLSKFMLSQGANI